MVRVMLETAKRVGCAVGLLLLLNGLAVIPARARNEAGDFNYYMLVLSWSPTYCDAQQDQGRDGGQQCSGQRPYAFVLHGLWPQYENGWPENCPTHDRPWVSNDLIGKMLDIMPARALVIHEYKKHGTCSGLSPDAYFDAARKLFEGIKIPERYAAPREALKVSSSELKQDLLTANPALSSEAVAISCNRDKLRDIRVCFTRDFKPRSCGSGDMRRSSCPMDKIILPPSRHSRGAQ